MVAEGGLHYKKLIFDIGISTEKIREEIVTFLQSKRKRH